MTRLDNDGEGTSGAALAATFAGGPNAFDTTVASGTGAALTYDNTFAQYGSTSMKMALPSGVASSVYCRWSPTSIPVTGTAAYARFYIYMTAYPSVTTRISTFMYNAASRSTLSVNSTGKLVGPTTTSGTLPLNTWVRIEHEVVNITGTSGDVNARMYSGNSTTPITNGTIASTGQAIGGSINEYRVGPTNTTTETGGAWSMWADAVAYSDVAQPGVPSVVTAGTEYSGAYLGGFSLTAINNFGTWRGKALDVVHIFITRAQWSDVEAGAEAVKAQGTAFAGAKLMCSAGMIPNSGGDLPTGAAGTYDAHWTNFATSLVNSGNANCWVRLGWEFNNDSFLWAVSPSASNTGGVDQSANYVAYWQRIVNAMRAAGFTGKFIWSPANGAFGQNSGKPDPVTAYPGDAYVDAIMPDQYDKWYNHAASTTTPQARWNNTLYGLTTVDGTTRGLVYWQAFAQSHSKIYGFGEWGLWDTTSTTGGVTQGGGGDDPYYIDQVDAHLTASRTAGVSTLECYFDVDANDGSHQIYPVGITNYTTSAAEYQVKFGSGTSQPTTAVAFATSGTGQVNAISMTCTIPTDAPVGSLALLVTACLEQQADPSGWNPITNAVISNTNLVTQIWRRVIAAGDPGSTFTFTFAAIEKAEWAIVCFNNAATTLPTADVPIATALVPATQVTSTVRQAPQTSAPAVTSGSMLLNIFSDRGAPGSTSYAIPSGYTTLAEQYQTSGGAKSIAVVGYNTAVTAGTTYSGASVTGTATNVPVNMYSMLVRAGTATKPSTTPTIVGSTVADTGTTGGATSISVPAVGSTAAGEVAVVFGALAAGTAYSLTTPTNWSLLQQGAQGATLQMYVWEKILVAADLSAAIPLAISPSAGRILLGTEIVINNGSYQGSTAVTAQAGASNIPAITPTVDNTLLLALVAATPTATGTSTTVTPPSGWSSVRFDEVTPASLQRSWVAIFSQQLGTNTAGVAQGPWTFTDAVVHTAALACVVAISPSSGGPPPQPNTATRYVFDGNNWNPLYTYRV